MSKFHSLAVTKLIQLSEDSVVISFDTSGTNNFSFVSGQYLTLKRDVDGEEVRRAYSICSSPTQDISIGVKLVEGGKMSTYLTKDVKVGDVLEVMPPAGNFVIKELKSHIVGICAGSGVTPIISMIKSVLKENNESKFTLLYGNKSVKSTMFYNELKSLEQNNSNRLKIHWAFSQESIPGSIKGRLDKNNIQQLFNTFSNLKLADDYFICGPGELIDNVNELLLLNNVNQSKINFERFTATKKSEAKDASEEIISNVTVCVDGDDFEFTLSNKGQTILDAAMEEGADVPFSCKGAVCCTCKAKVMEGKVTMDANYSLSEEEVADGFVLGCQARPASAHVVVDFDEM